MNKLNKSSLGDLIDCSTVIKRLEDNPGIWCSPSSDSIKDLKWGCVLDASWNDIGEGHSQGGSIIGVTGKDLWLHRKTPFGILSFISHKLKRKCPPTLAADGQPMSEPIVEVE